MTRTLRLKILAALLVVGTAPALRQSLAAGDEPLTVIVRVGAGEGPLWVGRGVNLTVLVAARDQRPKLELPAIRNARIWKVSASFQPIGASAIGGSASGENAFVTRLRLVAQSPGALVVPPIVARLDGREGRSQPLRLAFENPPIAGRPAGFLGGVGDFEIQAELDPPRVQVGREVEYRIRISGPAALGMTSWPDPTRLQAPPIAPRVEAHAVDAVDEPPSRTFIYKLKPAKPGKVALPPVLVASFDPRTRSYMTRASRGVPLEVVAAPVFGAEDLDYEAPQPSRLRAVFAVVGGLILGAAAVAGAIAAGLFLKRRWIKPPTTGRSAARRFARAIADRLDAEVDDDDDAARLARETLDALTEYARLGADRPPGALTPDEARAAVAQASGSNLLGERAAGLTARCDQILFAGEGEASGGDRRGFPRRDAQALFTALGRSNDWSRPRLGWGRRKRKRKKEASPPGLQLNGPPNKTNESSRC